MVSQPNRLFQRSTTMSFVNKIAMADHFAKTNSTLTTENEEKSRKTAVFRICIHCDRKKRNKKRKIISHSVFFYKKKEKNLCKMLSWYLNTI